MFKAVIGAFALSVSIGAQASMVDELIRTNLKPRSLIQEMSLLQEFAENQKAFCKTWAPKAFVVQNDLYEACQFPHLFVEYKKLLQIASQPELSGIELPESSFDPAEIPLLQSGAWQAVLFAEAEGPEVATRILLLRIALEKSLKAHGHVVSRSRAKEPFNSYASLTVPRLISVLSAYSKTLKVLTFTKHFECQNLKNPACQESRARIGNIKAQIAAASAQANLFKELQSLDSETDARTALKAQLVQSAVQSLQTVKKLATVTDIQKYLVGIGERVEIQNFKNVFEQMIEKKEGAGNRGYVDMLVAVSIMTEILEIQDAVVGASMMAPQRGAYFETASEELNVLRSMILKALIYNEVIL